MATLLAAAALASAAGGAYGAYKSGQTQDEANRNNASAQASNRAQQTQNSIIDLLNNYRNQQQQELDNRRYQEAVAREEAQRGFVNRLSTAGQQDAEGNALAYDPITGTWRVTQTGLAATQADRRRTLAANDYNRALTGRMVDDYNERDRLNQGARTQGTERSLGEALLARYGVNQGRSPEQMQASLIEKNVAEAIDPLQRGGDMALLAGYRQGNSGNDALMGALARQGTGATRSAIANARFSGPGESYSERSAASQGILSPATTLNARGNADPGASAPVFGSDNGNALLSAIAKVNPAGVGTTLSPRSGGQAQVRQNPGSLQGFTPLNASGNMAAGVSESLSSLLKNPELRSTISNWWNKPSADTYINAPDYRAAGYGSSNYNESFLY